MKCDLFAMLIDELASCREAKTGLERRLADHASGCEACAGRLAEAQELTKRLRGLATEDQQVEAPARLESILLSAFRERRQQRFWRTPGWRWGLAAAFACLIVAAALAIWINHPPIRKTQPAVAASGPQSLSIHSGRPESGVHANESEAANRQIARGSAEYSGFIPLPYGDRSPGNLQLVHVEISQTALASMGFPANDTAPSSYVKADILIGEDGIARAIRFDSR